MTQRKLIVLDLDNTLWDGNLGDGWMRVVPFTAFQQALKALKDRGVMLAIVSKNDELDALQTIGDLGNRGMLLREQDFVAHRINWDDKAANITSIAEELNIGLDSIVFIDDSPQERNRVQTALPDVLVPDWPVDKTGYVQALQALDCFGGVDESTTDEDAMRTELYARERERAKSRSPGTSLGDWLKTLGTKVDIRPITIEDIPRAVQLLNKTNQMNLQTHRTTEQLFKTSMCKPANRNWTVRVSDRFGDAGLVGVIGTRVVDDTVYVMDFVLSCRVIGRLVEEAMVAHIIDATRNANISCIKANLIVTLRNGPCQAFWNERSGFERYDNDYVFNVKAKSDAGV